MQVSNVETTNSLSLAGFAEGPLPMPLGWIIEAVYMEIVENSRPRSTNQERALRQEPDFPTPPPPSNVAVAPGAPCPRAGCMAPVTTPR